MPIDPNLPATQDDVQLELAKAKLEVKQQRATAIGNLLDKATAVLSDVLDNPNTPSRTKLDAAGLAVNLYIQQENAERQDKSLELQQKRLEIEEQKLRLPGGSLFQQNNVYLNGSAPSSVPVDPQLAEIERQALLERKRTQDAILKSYIPKRDEDQT